MSNTRILLLSVKPEFANRILNGTKTVELRRRLPKIEPGDKIALYVSSPVKQLVATLEIENVKIEKPTMLWKVVAEKAGLSRLEYDRYFKGSTKAVGIFLKNVKQKGSPLTLAHMRSVIRGFHPPQSFRYLREDERLALSI